MFDSVNIKQKTGLERARYQYDTARKLGHSRDSAMAGAVYAYMLESGDSRTQAEIRVPRFIDLEPEIPGGVL